MWATSLVAGACAAERATAPDAAPALDAGPDARIDAEIPPDADVGIEGARPRPVRSQRSFCHLDGTASEDLPRVAHVPLAGPAVEHPIALITRPSEPEALYVVEQVGRLLRLDLSQSPYVPQTVLDLRSRLTCCESGGLLSVALHPDYDDNGLLYVHYAVGAPSRSIVSRFHVDPETGTFALTSERQVLSFSHAGSEGLGGPLLFDAQGHLLIAFGYGGADPLDPEGAPPWAGAILRLAVDPGVDAIGYSVPVDNPFASGDERPPEVLAYGLADPRACFVDPEDDALYCADRGEFYSEVHRIEVGRDHGYPRVDGVVCTATGQLCLGMGVEPLVAYPHLDDQCGIASIAPPLLSSQEPLGERASETALIGVVAYADACSGVLSGLGLRGPHERKRSAMGAWPEPMALARTASGGLLVSDARGVLGRLELLPDGEPGTLPDRLSATGCFTGERLHEPAPDMIPFEVRSPLWSDGTHKRRYMVIPHDAQIAAPAQGPWELPVGTLLVKEFALQFDDRDERSVRPIETRFMVRRSAGWEFQSFRWNEAGTDAERVRRGVEVDYEVMRRGAPHTQSYQFPARATCPVCHSGAPGRPLGPRTDQLNQALLYEDGMHNQIEVLDGLGVLARAPNMDAPLDALPRLPDPADERESAEARARSYLHANCAHCHQPGGYSSPDFTMDLRFERTLAQTRTCGQEPLFFDGAPYLIAPGSPHQSALWVRARATDLDRMPPVATSEVDLFGVVLLTRWIESLERCPPDP